MTMRRTAGMIAIAAGLSATACERGARGERSASPSPSPAVAATAPQTSSPSPAAQVYDIRATVVSIDAESGTVNLDHQAIPGLMAAMKMEYQVRDNGMLQGLKAGDRVSGRLEARDGEYMIVSLAKQSGR